MEAEQAFKEEQDEEEKILAMVMQASLKEEEERVQKIKEVQKQEEEIVHKIEEASIEEFKIDEVKRQASLKEEVQKTQIEEVKHEPIAVQIAKEEVKQTAPTMKSTRLNAEQPKPSYSLPPVSMKKGGMSAFDFEILKQQQDAINKISQAQEEAEHANHVQDPNEGKTMAEILREKREATDKILESTKVNQKESIEERRERLRAHRD